MNFCPNCGHALAPSNPEPANKAEAVTTTVAALASLRSKLTELAPRFHNMNDDSFGDWVDALTQPEFFELIGLGNEGIAQVINDAIAV